MLGNIKISGVGDRDSMQRLSSELTKSIGGCFRAWPRLYFAPCMHWIAERRSENVKRQRSQDMVELYDWSHFVARHEASLL